MATEFSYTVLRSPRRRSVTIKVSPDNRISISVPPHLSEKKIEEIIRMKSGWIRKQIEHNQNRPLLKPKSYENGETFFFLGEPLRLQIEETEKDNVEVRGEMLVISISAKRRSMNTAAYAALCLNRWYQEQAEKILRERTAVFAAKMKVRPNSVRIKTVRSRWGSCTRSGNLTYNWKIVMAPSAVLDYVVIHELAHMIHLNHSQKFWKKVSEFDSRYDEHRKWLHRHAPFLEI